MMLSFDAMYEIDYKPTTKKNWSWAYSYNGGEGPPGGLAAASCFWRPEYKIAHMGKMHLWPPPIDARTAVSMASNRMEPGRHKNYSSFLELTRTIARTYKAARIQCT